MAAPEASTCRSCDTLGALAFATKSSITKARRRFGVVPLAELYRRVVRALARSTLPSAFYRDHLLISLDGTTLDLPAMAEIDSD